MALPCLENGNVKAVDDGSAVITVTVKTSDGKTYTATCTVTVTSTYTITVQERRDALGTPLMVYDVFVTKNGDDFTDYVQIDFNGLETSYKHKNVLSYGQKSKITGTASITLKNTKINNVNVEFK